MINVVCAIIINDNKILICQRSKKMKLPLQWEFPGGKVENDENEKDGLKREIMEELNLQIDVKHRLTNVIHHYPDFSINLIPFICKIINGKPIPIEHKAIKWAEWNELKSYDWAAADVPIVDELLNLRTKNPR